MAGTKAQPEPPVSVQWTVRPDEERYRQLLRWLFADPSARDDGDDRPA
jgi:hypothetical protein